MRTYICTVHATDPRWDATVRKIDWGIAMHRDMRKSFQNQDVHVILIAGNCADDISHRHDEK